MFDGASPFIPIGSITMANAIEGGANWSRLIATRAGEIDDSL